LGFIFGKLPLQHLPLARILFCAILPAFVPAKNTHKKGHYFFDRVILLFLRILKNAQ